MSIPESDLSWQSQYDYAINSLALYENDKEPGRAVNIRDLVVEKVTDVAKVEEKNTISGADCSTDSWKGRNRYLTSEYQGSTASYDG